MYKLTPGHDRADRRRQRGLITSAAALVASIGLIGLFIAPLGASGPARHFLRSTGSSTSIAPVSDDMLAELASKGGLVAFRSLPPGPDPAVTKDDALSAVRDHSVYAASPPSAISLVWAERPEPDVVAGLYWLIVLEPAVPIAADGPGEIGISGGQSQVPTPIEQTVEAVLVNAESGAISQEDAFFDPDLH